MKLKVCILLTLFFCKQSQAVVFQGLDIKGDSLAFAQKGEVFLTSIKQTKVLTSFKPTADTVLMDKILKKILQDHSINGETRKSLKSSVRSMAITNLTWVNNKLVIGMHYYEGKFDQSLIRFLVIRYDARLKPEGFCLLSSRGVFVCINPYFPLEFRNDSSLYLSYYSDSNYVAEFRMNVKDNTLSEVAKIKTNRLKDFTRHLSASLIMSQLPFSVRYMGFGLFVQFPFPVLLNGSNTVVYDADNSLRKLRDKKRLPNYADGRFLDLEQKMAIDSSVFISSYSNRDSFWILKSSKNKDKLQLLAFDKKLMKPTITEFAYDPEYRYFLDRRRIVGLSWKSGVLKIEEIERK